MRRIEAMRARNAARTDRFLDARLRTIGLDIDALDAQMHERRSREKREQVSPYSCAAAAQGVLIVRSHQNQTASQ